MMIKPGLSRISSLLAPLYNTYPTLRFRTVHVAGTNGKGGVAALLSTFLHHIGYSVGRFTSPHLIDRWDGITINNTAIPFSTFRHVEKNFEARNVREEINATSFEILTATAFQLFCDEGVDVAVVECGLGGRGDATNVLRDQDVAVSILTQVGLDHVEFLGGTIEAITREKVGIFRRGVPVVVDGSVGEDVMGVVRQRLMELGWDGRHGQIRDYDTTTVATEVGREMKLAAHQIENLRTAWKAFCYLERALPTPAQPSGLPVAPSAVISSSHEPSLPLKEPQSASEQGISRNELTAMHLEHLIQDAQASLPGRLQWLSLPPQLLQNLSPAQEQTASKLDTTMKSEVSEDTQDIPSLPPRVLLDGAHNPQSTTALSAYVSQHLRRPCMDASTSTASTTDLPLNTSSSENASQERPITFLLAVKNDKDIDLILQTLVRRHDNVVTCSFGPVDGMPWVNAMDARELADKVGCLTDGTVKAIGAAAVDEGELDQAQVYDNAKIKSAIIEAVQLATRQSQTGDGIPRLCITGSLYLVGDVLRCVRSTGESMWLNNGHRGENVQHCRFT